MIACERHADWTEATVIDQCGRHTKVQSWHMKQWKLGGLNSAPLCPSSFTGLSLSDWVPTFTQSRETIQPQKTAVELLTVRSVWEHGRLFVHTLFFLPFYLILEICPRQQLPLAVCLKMIWIYPVVGLNCGIPLRIKTSLYTPFTSLRGQSLFAEGAKTVTFYSFNLDRSGVDLNGVLKLYFAGFLCKRISFACASICILAENKIDNTSYDYSKHETEED